MEKRKLKIFFSFFLFAKTMVYIHVFVNQLNVKAGLILKAKTIYRDMVQFSNGNSKFTAFFL